MKIFRLLSYYVVGNPPYVRHELIPKELITEYRKRFQTIFDTEDLYFPFIEKTLLSFEPKGKLGIICSDPWMKNRYLGPLRNLFADHFPLKYYLEMVDTPAFHAEVSAFPAITIIAKEKAENTRLAQRPDIKDSALKRLASDMTVRRKLSNNNIIEITSFLLIMTPDVQGRTVQWRGRAFRFSFKKTGR